MNIKITNIKLNPKNPRIIKDDKFTKLVKSITDFPQMLEKRPLVCFTDTDGKFVVLGGNMRLKAAKEVGLKELPVVLADDWTEEQKNEFLIKDNVGFGEWQWDELAADWAAQQLQDWGLDIPVFEVAPEAVEDDFDGVPPKEPITVLGDLYELNEHRLHCADSCDSDAVAKLMNGVKADIAIQSPPYNVGKTPNGNEQKYNNDSDNKSGFDYLKLIEETTKNAVLNSVFSFINIQSVAGNKLTLIEYLAILKDWFCDYIIWDKMQAEPAMGENVLNSRFEFVYVFGESAKRRIGVKKFRGNLENMIFIKSRQDKEFAKVHKATYPVAFAAYFIENFSVQSVLDLFGGTGTTMIAADQLGRRSFLSDMDESYCDIIVARYIKHRRETGGSLVIKRNGHQLSEDEINKFIDNTKAE